MWIYGVTLGFLAVCSWQDLRRKRISVLWLGIGGAAAVLIQLFCRKLAWWEFAAGAGIGGLLLGVSFVTGEALGYGDSLAVLVMGMFLGFSAAGEILLTGFFLVAAAGGILLALGRAKRKDELPFLPFLTAAAGLFLVIGGGR